MKIRLLLIIAIICLGRTFSCAQSTVTLSGGIGLRDVFYSGVPLADGNYVEVGFFNSGFDITANANDLSALAGAWNEYGFTPIQTVFGQAGRFGDDVSSSNPLFDNKQIYMWIFKTSNDGSPDPGLANVLGYGLYTSALPSWTFPMQGAPTPTMISSSDVDQSFFGSFDPNHLFLSPVPEPSTYALIAVGVVPLLFSLLFKKRTSRSAGSRRAS